MERLFWTATLVLSFGSVWAGDFSESERRSLIEELESTRDALVEEVEGLTRQQAVFQPAEDKWAAIHVLEHIVLAEKQILSLIESMLEGEPRDGVERGADDEQVARFVVDRTRTFNAPERIQPKGEYATIREGIEDFLTVRKQSLELVRGIDRDLRAYRAENPVLGTLDGYQWVTFLSGHCKRHTLQIQEIKASPGYPAG